MEIKTATFTLFLLLSVALVTEETFSTSNYFFSSKPCNSNPNLNFRFDTIINASDYPGENDTERLQAALDDVPPEGAIVIIPPGTWTACGLIAKSKTIIQGFNGTILERPANKTTPFITFENRSEFAVFNITFNGKGVSEAYGIRIIDSETFALSHNTFFGVEKSAIKVLVTLNGTSEHFTITHNHFQNCNVVPIFLFGSPGERRIRDFTISDNVVTNGLTNGKIGVAFASDGVVANNIITCTQYGIATRCVTNLTIEGNVIENFTDYGIYLGTQLCDEGTSNIVIQNNTVALGNIGITKYYGDVFAIKNITLMNNYFVNNTSYDIMADFPAFFINNVITSADKLLLLHTEVSFKGTRTISGESVMPGDINHDLEIDIIDIATIGLAYGSVPGNENWNPNADIITDKTIDILDVAYVANLFGSNEN